MKPYLFYKGSKLFCAMLPDGEYNSLRSDFRSWEDFIEAKERAIANALPVSNVEIINIGLSKTDVLKLICDEEFADDKEGELYRWPGKVEKELFDDGDDRFVIEMYRLILPYNMEDKIFIEEK